MKTNLLNSLEKLLAAQSKVDRQRTKIAIIMNAAFLYKPETGELARSLMNKVNSFISLPDRRNTDDLIAIKERINNKY